MATRRGLELFFVGHSWTRIDTRRCLRTRSKGASFETSTKCSTCFCYCCEANMGLCSDQRKNSPQSSSHLRSKATYGIDLKPLALKLLANPVGTCWLGCFSLDLHGSDTRVSRHFTLMGLSRTSTTLAQLQGEDPPPWFQMCAISVLATVWHYATVQM